MQLPLSYWDVGIWLAVNAVILLVASELIVTYPGKTLKINKRALRMAAMILGILFALFVVNEAYHTWMTLQP